MDKALAGSKWLVGNGLSLADMGFLPYIERLEQLQLRDWWQKRPNIDAWLRRLRDTSAYEKGLSEWHNPDYIKLMSESGMHSWPKLAALLGTRPLGK